MSIAGGNPKASFLKKLRASGIMPARCTKFAIRIEAGSPVRIETEQLVTTEQMDHVVALLESGADAGAYVREAILREESGERAMKVELL